MMNFMLLIGFFHAGFNCGEAANIATPEWLRVAKDAAIRRASINCPPMVSHFQLLYDLALSLCSRIPKSINSAPRSSRLKDKKRGEGENLIKELFVEDVMKNNDMLHILAEGSSIVLLPQNSLDDSVGSNLRIASRIKGNPSFPLGLCSPEEEMKASEHLVSGTFMPDRKCGAKQAGFYSVDGKSSVWEDKRFPVLSGSDDASTLTSLTHKPDTERERTTQGDRLSDQGLFSCVTCGILSFACVAIVQPREAAAHYLMSADCSIFNDGDVGPQVTSDGFTVATGAANLRKLNSTPGPMGNSNPDGLFDVPIQSADQIRTADESTEVVSNTESQEGPSVLGLLALTYNNLSDSEEEEVEADIPVYDSETKFRDCSPDCRFQCDDTGLSSLKNNEATGCHRHGFGDDVPLQAIDSCANNGSPRCNYRSSTHECSAEFKADNIASIESNSVRVRFRHQMKLSPAAPNVSSTAHNALTSINNVIFENTNLLFGRSDEDSSRLHVFCLQHAAEVEQQLRPIGGSHILLLCHPDYPELEAEAKLVAEEQGIDYFWNDIAFREATKEDEERIQSALEGEEGIHGNGDWAVKLGINLYYSANLSRSPLYSKQMPYNSIIYKAFGRGSLSDSRTKPKIPGKGSGKQKKIVVVGKWCGKVWMSNQVHPLLAERAAEEEEEEEEERTLRAWAKPEAKHERPSESAHPTEATSTSRNIRKKRKNAFHKEGGVIKKTKYPKIEDPAKASDDDSLEEGYRQHLKRPRSKQPKPESPRPRKSSDRNSGLFDSFIEEGMEGGPSTRLRKRTSKPPKDLTAKPVIEGKLVLKKQITSKKAKKSQAVKAPTACSNTKTRDEDEEYPCDVEGCTMSFCSKQELVLHKRNICPVKGCGKKFFSHKYLVQHRRVHMDDRPLKCPWKGCKMTFKWAWARTEHIRVHTGARPYVCNEAGCGQTFRFVSDFSRHKRKTGHSAKKGRG
ncbi:hypothetical protein U1Q18_007175 [Sarracenia purpurea var. burkii]